MRLASLHGLLLALAMLALAGCGGTESPTEALSADVVRQRAIVALESVSTVRFEVRHETGSTSIGTGLLLESASGAAVFPDRAETTAKARASAFNVVVELGIVQIAGDAYMQDPFSGAWREVAPGSLPFAFNAMNVAVADVLAGATGLTLADDGSSSGPYVIHGTLRSESLRALVPAAAEGLTLGLEVTVERDSFLVQRVRLSGPFIDGEAADIVRVVEFDRFGEPTTIEPPL